MPTDYKKQTCTDESSSDKSSDPATPDKNEYTPE